MASASRLSRFVEFGKKIVCVGRNYSEHAKELNNPLPSEPVVFLKPTTSYITQGQPIKIPRNCKEIHHEVELAVVIGKNGSCIPESHAMEHVGGYALALDMTNRDLQTKLKSKGLPWAISKGFDTSCPVSDFIPPESVLDPSHLQLTLKVNGEVKQDGNTQDMIFSVPYLISWISERFSLETGDLILTGTPSGVGPVKEGDQIEASIADIIKINFDVEKS